MGVTCANVHWDGGGVWDVSHWTELTQTTILTLTQTISNPTLTQPILNPTQTQITIPTFTVTKNHDNGTRNLLQWDQESGKVGPGISFQWDQELGKVGPGTGIE